MALTSKLTDIADAVRGLTGETGKMTLDEISASVRNYQPPAPSYETPSIEVSAGGLITASANGKSNTSQLSTQAAKSVTPTKSQQTAVSTGRYTTGAVTVSAIPSEYIIPSGSQTLSENKSYDVASLAGVTVAVPIPSFVTVRTGSATPAASLGNNGDLYLKLV